METTMQQVIDRALLGKVANGKKITDVIITNEQDGNSPWQADAYSVIRLCFEDGTAKSFESHDKFDLL